MPRGRITEIEFLEISVRGDLSKTARKRILTARTIGRPQNEIKETNTVGEGLEVAEKNEQRSGVEVWIEGYTAVLNINTRCIFTYSVHDSGALTSPL